MTTLQDLLDRGDREGARKGALKVLSTKTTDGEALSTLARLAIEAGDVDAARQHLARVSPRERQSYDVQLAEAVLQQVTGQPEAARIAFAQLTGAFPTRPEGFFALGVSLLEKEDAKGAEKALATATKLSPKHFLYRFRHAESLAQLGSIDACFSALTTTIELRPDFVPAYVALSRMMVASNQPGPALEMIEAGLVVRPNDRELLAEQLRVKLKSGSIDDALASIEKAPGGPLVVVQELAEVGAVDDALAVVEHLKAAGHGSTKLALLEGVVLERANRIDDALAVYAAAMESDATDWAAASNRGLLLLEISEADESRLDEAASMLEQAVKRAGKKAADPLFNLALLQGRREEWAPAIATAKKAIAHPAIGGLKPQAEALLASLQKAQKATKRPTKGAKA